MKKTLLSVALGTALGLSATPSQALNTNVNLEFSGLLTFLDPGGFAITNVSKPYYYDATWGYGLRTQISGTMQFDTNTGAGTGTISPFEFLNGNGSTYFSNFELQAIGDGVGGPGSLMIANLDFNWNGNPPVSTQVVLDAAGLFTELAGGISYGDTFDAVSCATSGACTTPASNDIKQGKYPIGPAPISTSSFNTSGQTGFGTTLAQLSLGTDDGIGGSPMDNGSLSGFNLNYDFTSITVVSTVPVPAAAWLFGSGLLGLASFARRRKS